MSRHRFLKEFEREAYEELYDEEEELEDFENTPAFQSELRNAIQEVKEIVGTHFPEDEIEETLYYYQLDVTKSVRWLLEGIDANAQPKVLKKTQAPKENTKPASKSPKKESFLLSPTLSSSNTPTPPSSSSSSSSFTISSLSSLLQKSLTLSHAAPSSSSSLFPQPLPSTSTYPSLSQNTIPHLNPPTSSFPSLNLNSLPFAKKNTLNPSLTPSSIISTPVSSSTFTLTSSLSPSKRTYSTTSPTIATPTAATTTTVTTSLPSSFPSSSFSTSNSSLTCPSNFSVIQRLLTPSSSFSQTLLLPSTATSSLASLSNSLSSSTLTTSILTSFPSYPYPYLYSSSPTNTSSSFSSSSLHSRFFLFNVPSPDDKVAAARAKIPTSSSKSSVSKQSATSSSKTEKKTSKSTSNPSISSTPPTSSTSSSSTNLKKSSKSTVKQNDTSKLVKSMASITLNEPSSSSSPVLKKSQQELQRAYQSRRAHLNLVVIGHVDAGKSTLVGHLLALTGQVDSKLLHKFERQSKEIGKSSFHFAWVMDATHEERDRGVTMALGFTKLETDTKVYQFMDAPGHQDWVSHMISGACMADIACLVIDASPGAFETGLERGQTKEHALLMKAMGVSQVIVLVNKMDRVEGNESRFLDIQTQISNFLATLHYPKIMVIPVAGLTGDNLITRPNVDSHLHWYSGPCFLEALDQVQLPERPLWQPFRMRVCEVQGLVCQGPIDSGSIQVGESVFVLPLRTSATIRSIFMDGTPTTFAVAGDYVGVQLASVDPESLTSHLVLCSPSHPVPFTDTLECKVVLFDCKVPITPGFPFIFHQSSINEPGHVKALLGLIDKSSGEITKKRPKCVTKGATVLMEIQLDRCICVEHHDVSKQFGRFSLRRGGETVGAGIVTKILEPKSNDEDFI